MRVKGRRFLFPLGGGQALPGLFFFFAGCVSSQQETSPTTTLESFLEAKPAGRFTPEPHMGTARHVPWNSGFWPDAFGGIARRWSTELLTEAVYYGTPPPDSLARLTRDQLAQLSPAEKWDLLRGDSTFSTTRELRGGSTLLSPAWSGLCTGVALASLVSSEPEPVDVRTPLGLVVPFGSADTKAILGFLEQKHVEQSVIRFGERCDAFEPRAPSRECDDVSAADFHEVLTELLGRRHEAFIADTSWDAQVWNHVFYAYELRVIADEAPPGDAPRGTRRALTLVADVKANSYRVPDQWAPLGVSGSDVEKFTYHYVLFLDKESRIVGSRWLSYEKPDYFWRRKPLDLASLEPSVAPLLAKTGAAKL